MRMLKVAVVVMGVLIVAGVAVLAVALTQRVGSLVAGGPAAPVLLDEPAGTHIAGMSLTADRLALRLQGGGPDRVVVLDSRSGRVMARVGLAR
jgi:hypothetical protein